MKSINKCTFAALLSFLLMLGAFTHGQAQTQCPPTGLVFGIGSALENTTGSTGFDTPADRGNCFDTAHPLAQQHARTLCPVNCLFDTDGLVQSSTYTKLPGIALLSCTIITRHDCFIDPAKPKPEPLPDDFGHGGAWLPGALAVLFIVKRVVASAMIATPEPISTGAGLVLLASP